MKTLLYVKEPHTTDTIRDSICMTYPEMANPELADCQALTTKRLVVARGQGEKGSREGLLNGSGASFWGNENVLEAGGDSGTIL